MPVIHTQTYLELVLQFLVNLLQFLVGHLGLTQDLFALSVQHCRLLQGLTGFAQTLLGFNPIDKLTCRACFFKPATLIYEGRGRSCEKCS